MTEAHSFVPNKKRSAVALRTLYPSLFNPKDEKVREIIAIVKDFQVVPPETFNKYIESYVSKFGITRSTVSELLADKNKYHDFTRRDEDYRLQIIKEGTVISIFVSKKVTGYVYGFSYDNKQIICKFESISAPSQIFSSSDSNIYQVIFNNPIEELKARFSQ
jgi:hypothetical protein